MSDLGRLFRLRGTPDQEPLENFSTVALAIAIGHDDRPIKQALRQVDMTCQDAHDCPPLAACRETPDCPPLAVFDATATDIESVTANTQVALWPDAGPPEGYLDLVLHVLDSHRRPFEIWVEVKVYAPVSGRQLWTYRRHAARRSPSPAIITLGRARVSPYFPCLKWTDVADAIASVANPHHAWLSLREFLLAERIVRPPVPTDTIDEAQCIDVVADVNQRLRRLWPDVGLGWVDGTLRRALSTSLRDSHELVASAGPLRYGLMAAGTGWEWGVAVRTENFQKIPLDAQEMLRDADVGGLPQDWVRHPDRPETLERRLAPGGPRSHEEIGAWFEEGLVQLKTARVLDRFLQGRAKKFAAKAGTVDAPGETDDDGRSGP